MKIYHIVLPAEWNSAKELESYSAASLETEGFIHCSFRRQIEEVLERYYKGAGEVIVLEIDSDLLASKLVVEASTGGDFYPHIYGSINRNAVSAEIRMTAP